MTATLILSLTDVRVATRHTVPVMDTSGARVKVLPPLLFLVVLAGALVADRLLPLPLPGGGARVVAGVALVVAGLAVMAWAGRAMWGSHTTVSPWARVSALVTSGPFRFTRNPIYLGDLLVYLGVALWVGTWWPVLFLPLLFPAVQWLVIGPEEHYLTARFGDDYTAYRQRVRRWI
jgi:protein-S-isoprenylcysteine O-methyltransferase Ste14